MARFARDKNMSVIAIKKTKDKIVIGADSIRVSWATQEKDKNAKLFNLGDGFVIAHCGLCSDAVALVDFAKVTKPRYATENGVIDWFRSFVKHCKDQRDSNDCKLDNSNFIIVFNKKIFYFQNWFVREIKDYYADGAGRDFALSALYIGMPVRTAIETACHLSIYCEKPINIIEIKL